MIGPLEAWQGFYIIVGSSAAALTGLQFVVITLVAESGRASSLRTISAFGTPTVVHFCTVFFVAALLAAPWSGLSGVAWALGATGLGGIVYIAIVIGRARTQKAYEPELSDWIWHTAIPFVAYLTLAGAALALENPHALFFIGAASLLLLFVGIHNAWDTVTYLAVGQLESTARQRADDRASSGPAPGPEARESEKVAPR